MAESSFFEMSWAAASALEDAYAATKGFLLPVERGVWLRLMVVVLFLGGGGGGVPNFFNGVSNVGSPSGFQGPPSAGLGEVPGWVFLLGAAVLVLVLLLGYLGAVMRFVLFDALREEEVELRRMVPRRLGDGGRLFLFHAGLGLLVVIPVAGGVLSVMAVGPLALLPLIPVLLVALVAVGLVSFFTDDFVVQSMIRRDKGVLGSWRGFWPLLRSEWREFGVYLVLRWVAGLVVGILTFLATLVLVLALGFLLGVPAVVVVVLAGGLGAATASTPFLAALIFLGLLFVAGLFLGMMVVQVPVQCFLFYFAMLVLGDLEPGLDLIPEVRERVSG